MFATEARLNRFLMGYARMLLADISDEQMAEQRVEGINHPAWILGHLIYSADSAIGAAGGDKTLSDEFIKKYAGGSKLTNIRADYPSTKEELLNDLDARFAKAIELAANASEEVLARPTPSPRLRPTLPTMRDLLPFLFTVHFSLHLGQLSAWRRTMGLAPLF